MPKIDIEVTIKNSEITDSYKVKAIINDSVIKYKEPDDTTVLFDYKENILTRENDQMKIYRILNDIGLLTRFDNEELKKSILKYSSELIK